MSEIIKDFAIFVSIVAAIFIPSFIVAHWVVGRIETEAKEIVDRESLVKVPRPDSIPNSPQFVDFDDLAGLDRETQAMLEERRRQDRSDQQRLERIEWNIRVLNHRMFGASVIVPAGRSPRGGLGQVGEMPLESLEFEPESETTFGDGPQPEPEQ